MTVTGTTVQPVALTPNRGPTEEPGGTEAAGTGTGHRLRALLIEAMLNASASGRRSEVGAGAFSAHAVSPRQ